MKQTTDTLLLVRPLSFRKNEQTAVNNYFQQDSSEKNVNISENALIEFDKLVTILRKNGVRTIVLEDNAQYDTPDSIFPNNCISFHNDTAILYPMYALNRRLERNIGFIKALRQCGFSYSTVLDYTAYEKQNLFLEGTGSLILDRINKKAYCSISARAHNELVERFCADNGFSPFVFHALQTVEGKRKPIYHTNVMMALGSDFAVLCLESIDDEQERDLLTRSLIQDGKEIIEITEKQVEHFCGNILEVRSKDGVPLIVTSSQAFGAFDEQQKTLLSKHGRLVHSPLYTIEHCGGGSARCMMAEVF